MVVVWRCLVDGSSNRGNIDVDDLLGVGVEDGTEVERVGVLAVIHMWAVVHESLLEANSTSESLVEANCPG
jgi:hypothetical protein